MSDHMEMGNSGLVPMEGGWYLDKTTGNKVDPSGRVFDQKGEMIWDPDLNDLDEDYEHG